LGRCLAISLKLSNVHLLQVGIYFYQVTMMPSHQQYQM
jgi:hypothetical protein